MRLGVIIPTRGDRPKFLENCLRMLKAQTLQPEIVELVNDPPLNNDPDITYRYRIGYDRLRNKGLDLIALIEDDDWYHPAYLEYMCQKWWEYGRPGIIGTDFTIYYHIKEFGHFIMIHSERASAMNTLIRPDMDFSWCPDNEPFTDMHIWDSKTIMMTKNEYAPQNKVVIQSKTDWPKYPERILSLGIKHGVGLCGGRSHIDRLHRYIPNQDKNKEFLKSLMDTESFNFYINYFNQ